MSDSHYPTVDVTFLKKLIEESNKVEGIVQVGSTTAYLLKGKKPINDRLKILRQTKSGQVDFIYACGIATNIRCMGKLLDWLVENRDWKDGAYFVRKKTTAKKKA